MKYSNWEKLGFSVLCTAVLIGASIVLGNVLVSPEPVKYKPQAGTEKAGMEKSKTPAPAAEEPADMPSSALAMLAMATADQGAAVFKKCRACHNAAKDAKHKVGPNLWGVVGRGKASADGFKYSDALKGLGGEWTFANLDAYLTKPGVFAKGTSMSFTGLKKPAERAAIMMLLRSRADTPVSLP